MKRVLALHGHSHSGRLLKRKLAFLEAALSSEIEFVFLDAPHVLHYTDLPDTSAATCSPVDSLDYVTARRAWWFDEQKADDAHNIVASLAYVKDVLETRGPFHGIVGFSQGGAMALLVAGLLEYPDHCPHFRNIKHRPFEFAVCVAGHVVPNPLFFTPMDMRTPTLFIQGLNDATTVPEWTCHLLRRFEPGMLRIEFHEGGHFVPRKPIWKTFLTEYFKACSLGHSCPLHPPTVPLLIAHGNEFVTRVVPSCRSLPVYVRPELET